MTINIKSIYHSKNLDQKYFDRQMSNPYESTKSFFKFLNKEINLENKRIVDLACGNGANLLYLKRNYNTNECFGLDQNKSLLKTAKYFAKKRKIKNIRFLKQDIENTKNKISNRMKSDGVICIQTLSVLDDYKKAILFAKKFKPKFICVNSLFWKGAIDFKITVNFLKKNKKKREIEKINKYNIYSIQHYLNFLSQNGFNKHKVIKFKSKKNFKTKDKNLMGSHTVKVNGKKETKSGPLILEWFFILSQKEK
tara:strand:- start:4970 stop:5725 length:756 start_codon:yes stop_codon:yes gene_type:complete